MQSQPDHPPVDSQCVKPSDLAQFLARALPTVAANPGPLDCWAWKVLRRDPPQLARLSAAIRVVEQHGQLAALERRVREEHPSRRAHRKDYDSRLLDCLTEACAFAWAVSRGLGVPQFDYRQGKPDIHVPPDLWVEAKAVHPSLASRQDMARMLRGEVVLGLVAPPDRHRGLAFLCNLEDAKKKFARLGLGRWVVFLNLTDVDVDQFADLENVLASYATWLGRREAADPTICIVFCHSYDWQRPIRDPFHPQAQ